MTRSPVARTPFGPSTPLDLTATHPAPTQPETIAAGASRHGVDRRTLLRWGAAFAGVLAVPALPFAEEFAEAAATQPRLPVLWLTGQDCNGDSEGFLRATNPTPSQLLFDHISLDYSELLMAASGTTGDDPLKRLLAAYTPGSYILVVEGSIPTAANGVYCCVGGRTFASIVAEAASGAAAIIAAGSCAVDGGLPKAAGGITGATSVTTALGSTGKKIINMPGCPLNIDNLTTVLVQYLTQKTWPATDSSGKPTFAYGTSVHAKCPRRSAARVKVWGDAAHRAGGCLRDVGCQGPQTYANCPTVKFNSGTNFPIGAGAVCVGCTRPTFWSALPSVVSWTAPATSTASTTGGTA